MKNGDLSEEKAEVRMLKKQSKGARPEVRKMLREHIQMEKGHIRNLSRPK